MKYFLSRTPSFHTEKEFVYFNHVPLNQRWYLKVLNQIHGTNHTKKVKQSGCVKKQVGCETLFK